jgi:hypothetical protein
LFILAQPGFGDPGALLFFWQMSHFHELPASTFRLPDMSPEKLKRPTSSEGCRLGMMSLPDSIESMPRRINVGWKIRIRSLDSFHITQRNKVIGIAKM